MAIDKEKIIHVSKLARISLDKKKTEALAKDLSSIFKFIEQLNELNTDKIEPLSSILNEPYPKWKSLSLITEKLPKRK